MITAKIVKDSISPAGKRITSFELDFHRFVLAEFNTHKMVSKNSASSRAIPIEKVIQNIIDNPAIPVWWGKNQSGMQAKEELDNVIKVYREDRANWLGGVPYHQKLEYTDREWAEILWLIARDSAIQNAQTLAKLGVHKQIVNRLLEPWVITKVIATATDWDNFFHLRNHPDAQPEIWQLAKLMYEKYEANTPTRLTYGEWHLPYIETKFTYFPVEDTDESRLISYWSNNEQVSLEDAKKISASLCAQVSFRKADESLDKAIKIFDRLIESKPVHSSPTEHQGTPLDDPKAISGTFRGWLQFRHTIPNNTCYKYPEA